MAGFHRPKDLLRRLAAKSAQNAKSRPVAEALSLPPLDSKISRGRGGTLRSHIELSPGITAAGPFGGTEGWFGLGAFVLPTAEPFRSHRSMLEQPRPAPCPVETPKAMERVVRVGLGRHFPVREGMPRGWVTGRQLHEWRQRYDAAEVDPCGGQPEPHSWARCLTSDLPRAVITARALHTGALTATPLLREPQLAEFRTGALRLPMALWPWVLRLAWVTSHRSQRAAREDFLARVRQVAELLNQVRDDTLVVSHAGMMVFLRRELLRRGFVGPRFRIPDHGRIFVFARARTPADEAAAG